MITYVAILFARPGHELAVTKFYQDLEPLLREAPGYRGRKMLRARPGVMEAEVRRVTPPEELKGHAHEEGRDVERVVFGEVRNPGAYAVQKDTTVLQALSLAGGVTEHAATNRIKVVRLFDGQKRDVKVKLTDVVRPGDTVVVPERYF